jgi:hypothetical protein
VHPRVEQVSDRPLSRQFEDPPIRPPVSKPWPSGFEFYGMREYVPGDDLRRIVWRASARTGKVMVREAEQGITDHVTVVLDTEHDVQYSSLDPSRWLCRSYTTRISEVDDAGTDHEKVLTPDTGYGFLWRMHSYWRFQEQDGGVYVECRAISLTRNVPLALKLIVQPMVKKLPRESLINTLTATRQGVIARQMAKL